MAISSAYYSPKCQKAVIAFRAGQTDHNDSGIEIAWRIPWLLAAKEDNYPSTRRFAHYSLSALFER